MELALARIELMKNISPDSIHWEMFKNDCIEKEKEQNNKIIRDVFEHCWNHKNWNGQYDIKDMNDYLETLNK